MIEELSFKDLLDVVYAENPDSDLVFLYEAYVYAEKCHKGQFRKSGEPYIIHPLHVAITLAELGMDDNAIVAGLLHDVVEDTPATEEDLIERFGEEVAFLVAGVTKLDKLSCVSKEQRQQESYRKMFVAMAEDIRVVIIKLADRLHNMRTMNFQSPEKQRLIAKETLEIYAPIADRLGIIKLKWELEDLSLRYLEPDIYYDLVDRISMKRQEREAYIDEVIEVIKKELDHLGIHYTIEGRPKHFYSIYRKMVNKHKDLDEIYDLIAIRILVDTVQDCYAALGAVHLLWKPVPGRFKDYISLPKPNMYQSLHTTVIGPRSERFEIQIRTFEMHQVAEYGIAAHWLYKESGGSEGKGSSSQMAWINQIKELQNDSDDSKSFIENIKHELFSGYVYVFSPAGEVYELPRGATPIDFAYRVHTEIGNQCVGAKVNNKIVPFDYELKTGDTIEILRSKNSKGPAYDWLSIVQTSQARNKIRQWFKKNKRDENIEAGRATYERAVKKDKLKEEVFLDKDHLSQIASKLGYTSADDLLAAIGIASLSPTQVINRLKDEFKQELIDESEEEVLPKLAKARTDNSKHTKGGITVRGTDDVSVRFANCCKPVPGDPIVGYVTRGHGLTVHHAECANIVNLKKEDRQRLMEVHWEGYEDSVFQVNILVEALDRPKITPDVMGLINDTSVHILAITSRVKDHMAFMDLTLEVSDLNELTVVLEKISSIPDVINVKRGLSKKG